MSKKVDPGETSGFGGDWSEWCNYVLLELKRINEVQEDIWAEINKVKIDLGSRPGSGIMKTIEELKMELVKVITEMRIKSGLFGSIGALIPIVVFILYQVLKGL